MQHVRGVRCHELAADARLQAQRAFAAGLPAYVPEAAPPPNSTRDDGAAYASEGFWEAAWRGSFGRNPLPDTCPLFARKFLADTVSLDSRPFFTACDSLGYGPRCI